MECRIVSCKVKQGRTRPDGTGEQGRMAGEQKTSGFLGVYGGQAGRASSSPFSSSSLPSFPFPLSDDG